MKKTPWHKVEATGPAVAGLLVMIGGAFAAGPLGALGGLVVLFALVGYRIATRE